MQASLASRWGTLPGDNMDYRRLSYLYDLVEKEVKEEERELEERKRKAR